MIQCAMAKRSAGLLMYRRTAGGLEVLLVHPGGPYWAGRDAGAWSLPKGEYEIDFENPLDAAKREFVEETGFAPGSPLTSLGEVRLRSGKIISAWGISRRLQSCGHGFEQHRDRMAAAIRKAGGFSRSRSRCMVHD
jgi:predicted NUDIX family NTP pyrophosphohydrolase